jgi:hypothetical protein
LYVKADVVAGECKKENVMVLAPDPVEPGAEYRGLPKIAGILLPGDDALIKMLFELSVIVKPIISPVVLELCAKNDVVTKTLFEADVGVIETERPVTSTRLSLLLLNVSVFVVLFS